MTVDVIFRIIGDDLDPEIISTELGVAPDESFKKGELLSEKHTTKRKNGMWVKKSQVDDSATFSEKISSLLKIFLPKKDVLGKLSMEQNILVEFYCGVVFEDEDADSYNLFLLLEPKLLHKIGSCNIGLNLQFYP